MGNDNFVYIIDVYNNHLQPENICFTFKLNNREYCVRKCTLFWGRPELGYIDDEFLYFRLYSTLDEAREFVKKLKQLEGVRY